jgi:hypothetical protein
LPNGKIVATKQRICLGDIESKTFREKRNGKLGKINKRKERTNRFCKESRKD